ncbi:hypothetical protein MY4824_004497 [Beauveria thailandica]
MAARLAPVFRLLYLACLASAQDKTSAPNHLGPEVGWQNSPGRRGTLDIMLSCATTIFACTWSIQHLNVPGKRDTLWTNLVRSAMWMLITILLPEFILAHAIFELDMALKAKRMLNKRSSETEESLSWQSKLSRIWKSTPATIFMFCKSAPSNMFRFCKSIPAKISRLCKSAASKSRFLCGTTRLDHDAPASAVEHLPRPQPHEWTLRHCYFANMGGLYYRDEQLDDPDEVGRNRVIRFPLTAFQYAEHREALNAPDLTEDAIKDKSKQDTFARIVAVFQISYLVLSIGVRRHRGLPYTQLEVVTLGFAVCGIVTYLFYWYKPQNVKVAVEVTPKPAGSFKSAIGKPKSFEPKQDSIWEMLKNRKSQKKRFVVERIRNDNISQEAAGSTHAMLPVLSVLSVAFNCIHLLGWNATFPTRAERIVWQVLLLCSIIIPAVGLAVILLSQITLPAGDAPSFVIGCSRLLQELAWRHSDQTQLHDAQDALERACHSDDTAPSRRTHFGEIFPGRITAAASEILSHDQKRGSEPSTAPSHVTKWTLREAALLFVSRETMPLDLPRSFPKDFKRLVNHLEGNATKKLMENANTYVFPRRSLVPNSLNLAVLYVTSILYAASRLGILALALSSLRSLPEGVYVTTWTRYIPSFH